MLLLVKSWVRPHTRRLPDGRVVQVAGHQDRRTRQPEANPHQLDLDLENANNPAGPRSSPNSVGSPPQDPQLAALLKQYAGDSEVTPEEIHEAVRQHRDVEARYRGTPQWLKAPNGLPTGLNERQWVLVRTPNFKRWFGDWEGLVQQQRLDLFIDTALADPASQGTLVLRAVIPEERAEVLRQGGPDLAGMEHVLDAQELRHAMKSHGGADEVSRQPDQRPLKPDDLKRIAAVLDAPDELTVQPRQTNRTSLIYGRAFPDGKVEYVERVFETSTKHKPRLVTKTVWVKAAAGVGSSPTRVSAPYRNTSLAFSGGRINPDTVSKVVDPNGEPRVVYRALDKDRGPVLSGSKEKSGGRIYFTDVAAGAAEYAAWRGGSEPHTLSAFLRIVNPMPNDDTLSRAEYVAAKHDGRVHPGTFGGGETYFAADTSTQIKSAIGNAGTFRPDLGHMNKAHRHLWLFFRGHC